ncbi:MAG: hypothetical protein QG599_631 [Pseudomonadota bacterium]|nr:hypothetical protein [Pseudomonadota bacterium]
MTDDWKTRLTQQLEPVLMQPDPRPQLSIHHDLHYALFQYPPDQEFPLRQELALLRTRLEHAGKHITTISLADCLTAALEAEAMTGEALAEDEQAVGLETVIDTVADIISLAQPLYRRVADRMPAHPDPQRDLVFIVRVGALFPFYRTAPLPEQMQGQLHAPTVLFYPGDREGVGLRFMGLLEADYNYRCKIF